DARAARSRSRAGARAARFRTRAAARAHGRASRARATPTGTHGPRTRRPRTRAGRLRRPLPARSSQSAQELVVLHPPFALGLDLEELEPPVLHACPPDDEPSPFDDSARADVRRKRAHSVVQLLGRTFPDELAVRRGDLLRVRDALVRLGSELRRR